ncbi:MAG: IS256 family transposase [Caldisericia bacterium]|nr:IS256 family transposase [Caldisericia bacterium]
MEQTNVWKELSQVETAKAGEVFRDCIRGIVRSTYYDLMLEEVASLCGKRYTQGSVNDFLRAGSAPGICILNGKQEQVKRPRVRKRSGKKSKEHKLKSYSAGKNGDEVQDMILRAFLSGVSGRDQKGLYPGSPFTSKSSVSRLWATKGIEKLEELRNRDISEDKFFALMLDGIGLGNDLTAIVALGITLEGKKKIIDFHIGSTESSEVCDDLLTRIHKRGFKSEGRLLCVLDGSKALKKSTLKRYPDAVVQRCTIHKERNIRSYLSKRHHGELAGRFKTLRQMEGEEAVREAYKELSDFVKEKNSAAFESLNEAGESLIALQLLNVPATLNKSLLSTNLIENPFRNVRAKIGRVKRWRPETDQPSRWMAYALLEAEKGFRRIKGYREIDQLILKLKRSDSTSTILKEPVQPLAD